MKYRIARGPVSNGFAPNINVVEEAANVALSEYVEGNIKAIKKQFVGLKILTRDQILTFDNQPSERVVTENIQPGFPGLGFVLGYNRASFDRINKGFPQDQRQQNWRIQWVKAARMPFA
ncbi:MAG: hypothetical protein QGG42_13640, partial [Phycisphaerae bacterium]|nr:hypothetical protein [Phycisphaerae bacterium]